MYLAYLLFADVQTSQFISRLGNLKYLGTFIAGLFFSFGFTTPFSVGFFLALKPENILVHSLIGGLGAALSDILILKFVKFSFKDEIKKLKQEPVSREIKLITRKLIAKKIRFYLTYLFAGIIIASPLPDEIGITILSGISKVNVKAIGVISWIFNTLGILVMLTLGNGF